MTTQGQAQAQTITVNANYIPPVGGLPAAATPSGTFSVTNVNTVHVVIIDFGYVDVGGNFAAFPAVAAGGLPAQPGVLPLAFPKIVAGPNNYAAVAVNLNGWPANPLPGAYLVRARLMKQQTLLGYPAGWKEVATALNGSP